MSSGQRDLLIALAILVGVLLVLFIASQLYIAMDCTTVLGTRFCR